MSEQQSTVGDTSEVDGEAITVTELNEKVSRLIKMSRDDQLSFDYLLGDVSDDFVTNGNRYFDLVNQENDDKSSVTCLAFSGSRSKLPEFEEGDRIAVKGKITYYEARGSCTIYVDDVVPVGKSEFHEEILETRNTLEEEGLFADDAKQQLPEYPENIGVITSRDSDAEEDAVTSIHNVHPDIDIHLYNSNVQGMAAVEDLCTAIMHMDSLSYIDVIVVTRGGGSESDIYPFNTEGVSRMVADTETPIVTAIGHENDTPIVDDVADDRAMTPTEIGSVVAPDKSTLLSSVKAKEDRLYATYTATVDSGVSKRATSLTTEYDNHVTSQLSFMQSDLVNGYESFVTNTLQQAADAIETSYDAFYQQELSAYENQLESGFEKLQQQKQHEEEREDLEKQTKLYRNAAIALAVLLVLVFIYVFVF